MKLEGPQKTLAQTVGVVLTMGALAWASVPFYDWFCRVTGFGGTTSVADAGSDVILDDVVTIRFDASLERDMPWILASRSGSGVKLSVSWTVRKLPTTSARTSGRLVFLSFSGM